VTRFEVEIISTLTQRDAGSVGAEGAAASPIGGEAVTARQNEFTKEINKKHIFYKTWLLYDIYVRVCNEFQIICLSPPLQCTVHYTSYVCACLRVL